VNLGEHGFRIVAAIIGLIVANGFVIGKTVDWHLTLLAAAFAIPATVIVIAIIRSVYASQKQEDTDNLPALNLIKEIVVAVKEVLSSGK
jgi:membrane protein implicated in regulation of membrane protease activity